MTSARQQALRAMLADARQRPWDYSFFSLLRWLAAVEDDMLSIGEAQRIQQERFRLGQKATLAFAAREIAEVVERNGIPLIRIFSLGMLGPNGPLPLHYTDIVRERNENKRDHTLEDFLDMFHHRMFTHFYRVWAQAQSTVTLDRADDERFTRYIASLAGDEADEVTASALPAHARWASAAHRVRQSRNADGLVASLRHFFGVPVTLHSYQLHWIALEAADKTRLGHARQSTQLGSGAIIGEMVPDRQTRFRLVIGPLTMAQYQRFTPQQTSGQDLPILVEWVRAFVGFEYVWEVELLVKTHTAPPTVLGGEQQLGWSTWMGKETAQQTTDDYTSGMLFEPENYMHDYRAS